MKEQLHTIQLTRRELGLVHHIMSIKYADIDDNVKFGNTSRNQFWQDEYGKDAITGVYLKTRDEIYANYDTSSWICKDLQRKDPFTKPFCYNEKHENYYKNHMEVAQFMTNIETKIKQWLEDESQSSREIIAEYTDEHRPKCDDGSDDFIEGNYNTAQRLLLQIKEWEN